VWVAVYEFVQTSYHKVGWSALVYSVSKVFFAKPILVEIWCRSTILLLNCQVASFFLGFRTHSTVINTIMAVTPPKHHEPNQNRPGAAAGLAHAIDQPRPRRGYSDLSPLLSKM
jgi:hypothetical protein